MRRVLRSLLVIYQDVLVALLHHVELHPKVNCTQRQFSRSIALYLFRDVTIPEGEGKETPNPRPGAPQEPFKNTAATVMALRTTRSHWHPSLQAADQTVVIQTAPELRPVPQTALSGASLHPALLNRAHLVSVTSCFKTSAHLVRLFGRPTSWLVRTLLLVQYVLAVQESAGCVG